MLVEHVVLVLQTLAIALPIGVGAGVFVSLYDRASTPVLWFAGVLLTIPSIALFGVLVPVLGIGAPPVIAALVAYSLLPIIRNTYVGLDRADASTVEAGTGLGMTRWQRLRRVRLPVALPVVMAGVRNAVVIVVGLAAIGAFIGGPGLGDFIFYGISDGNTPMIVVTTVVLSALALTFDYGIAAVEELLRLRNGEDIDPTLATKTLRLLRPL
ncbi:ABC transporter permease [Halomarina oriensis]|uniref:ABC transporter permease subunit n=1 Tax=Halomarina oriensis TaxID=671145 RepID=A0A6B0GPN0_9EURY|nr:ABC transporter permease subunit [Halomarina oriensis]